MSEFDWERQTVFPVAKPGYMAIGILAFATLILAILQMAVLALAGLVFTIFVCCFYRDPDRLIPNKPDALVSPADGRIVHVGPVDANPFFEGACMKVSIFMSPFNVHINRMPFDGTVGKVIYNPGKFIRADLAEASSTNEHNAVFLHTDRGANICVVQISGMVARRIICGVQEGDKVARGQRYGMICLGSRVDLYLPEDFDASVAVKDRVKGGSSILGYLK